MVCSTCPQTFKKSYDHPWCRCCFKELCHKCNEGRLDEWIITSCAHCEKTLCKDCWKKTRQCGQYCERTRHIYQQSDASGPAIFIPDTLCRSLLWISENGTSLPHTCKLQIGHQSSHVNSSSTVFWGKSYCRSTLEVGTERHSCARLLNHDGMHRSFPDVKEWRTVDEDV
jgi:hypothetical protein